MKNKQNVNVKKKLKQGCKLCSQWQNLMFALAQAGNGQLGFVGYLGGLEMLRRRRRENISCHDNGGT